MPAEKKAAPKASAPMQNPKWPGLRKDLQRARKQLESTKRQLAAIRKARAALEKAEMAAAQAVDAAYALVKQIEETPPGQYPTVTG